MSPSELFIRRPVTTLLLALSLLIFGAIGYLKLPVSDLPPIDFPTLQISASLPGASPETMAASVATPLEKQLTTIAGISSMSSASALGSTQITLQFDLTRDLDAAAQDVQAALAAAAGQLPPDLPSPPTYRKVNPADQPILYLALTSKALPLSALDEYGETVMAQRISTLPGVAQVQLFGAQKYAVRIQLDPGALVARGIGLDEVTRAIEEANPNLPVGTLWGPHRATTVQATGQIPRAEGFRPLVVAWRDGKPVRLEELGKVLDSVENDKAAAWFQDERAVVLAVQRQPGTNTIEVAGAVRALLPSLQAQLPASVSVNLLFDRSESIRASVRDVKLTLLVTLVLVILTIFAFLRSFSATLVPAVALPLSLSGTFAVMYGLGYGLDNLSLLALTLSVGFVVDDAIVMLENIVRHLELGEPPHEAALRGSREIGFTIVSMTLSLAAVFLPVLLMGGLLGRLFHGFAVTIAVAILLSGAISLTLSPMLTSRIVRAPTSAKPGRLGAATERLFERSLALYERGLRFSLRHEALVLLLSVATLAGTFALFTRVPRGLFPSEDTGQLFAATETVQGTSFADFVRHQLEVARVVATQPGVESYISATGARGASANNQGILFLRLRPRSERELSADELIAELRPRLAQIPGIRTYVQNPPPIRLGGMLTRSQYQYTLQGPDPAALYQVSEELLGKARQLPGLVDVASDVQLQNPLVRVEIDRDRASAVGLSAAQLEEALYSAYASRRVSDIFTQSNTYQVLLELLPEHQEEAADLARLRIRAPSSGELVPLEAVASLVPGLGPLTVNHLGQLPAATISFNLAEGTSLGDAVEAFQREARATVPPAIHGGFQGAAGAYESSLKGLGLLLLLAVLIIYLVLGILYESFIHPLTILSALPFAGFGALAALALAGEQLTVYSFVGIVMLVGLVKKNGIMMVDFALVAQRERGATPRDAILEACRIRFRPIMMTTLAALVGTLPIALGVGAGSESRRPLGLAVVGGLLFSQLLTLFVTPVFFRVLSPLQARLEALAAPRRAAAPLDRAAARQ